MRWLAALALAGCTHFVTVNWGHLQPGARHFDMPPRVQVAQLQNGMTVALLPDDRTNLVSVDVRYATGAADDPAGRSGMAHLAEHVLFDVARPDAGGPTIMDQLGAVTLYVNGWTTRDYVHFTSVALADHLDDVLAIEAKRLATTCDQLDPQLFARERNVVLEEEAERASRMSSIDLAIDRAVWGNDHPYGRPEGGEIGPTSLDEVCGYLAATKSPDRTIVVITGHFGPIETNRAIATDFGAIARATTAAHVDVKPPALDASRSEVVAAVKRPLVVVSYAAPATGDADAAAYDLVRRYAEARLAADAGPKRWLVSTRIRDSGGDRARIMNVELSIDDAAHADDAVALVTGLFADWPNWWRRWSGLDVELAEARNHLFEAFDRFDGRGAWLTDYLQFGDPTGRGGLFLHDVDALATLDPARLDRWIADHLVGVPYHVTLVRPDPHAAPARATVADASAPELEPWRVPVDPAEATRALDVPAVKRGAVTDYTLGNGLRVVLAPDPEGIAFDARLVYPVGDHGGDVLPLASALDLGDDNDRSYHSDDLNRIDWAFGLGTDVDAGVDDRATTFEASGLALFADWNLWRLYWRLDQGGYPRRAAFAVPTGGPTRVDAMDALYQRLYGIAPLTLDHLPSSDDEQAFRTAHYRPRGATLIVSGGFDVTAMRQEIDDLFGQWTDTPTDAKDDAPPATPTGARWIEEADAQANQVDVAIGFLPAPEGDRAAARVLADMLDDRLRVVREKLGASYGVSTTWLRGPGGAALTLGGRLDPDHAGDALTAILGEIARLRAGGSEVADDFIRARRRALASMLGETAGAADVAAQLERAALDGDDPDQRTHAIAATTLDQVASFAKATLAEDRMVVVLGGPTADLDAALASVPHGDVERH